MNTDSFRTEDGFLIVYGTQNSGEQSYRIADIIRVTVDSEWCSRWDNQLLTMLMIGLPGLFGYYLLLSIPTIGGFIGIVKRCGVTSQ